MFQSLQHIPLFTEQYESELSAIEAAAERAAATVEAERARLVRSDGRLVYGPAKQSEREAAIYEAGGAAFDRATARYVEQAQRETADLERQIARLDGQDGWEQLSEAERRVAADRREFVREDVLTLPPVEVVTRARAAIAAGDKAASYLLRRYIAQRTAPTTADGVPVVRPMGGGHLELATVLRELLAVFGDEDRAQKHRDLEARLRAVKALPLAISAARRTVDGSDARLAAAMRTGRP